MPTTRKRILSAALLLPVVLFSVVWTSFALWRCQFDGVARSQCCCPKDPADHRKADPAASGVAQIKSGACCEIEQHDVDKAPAEAAGRSAAQLAAILASAVALPTALLGPVEPPLSESITIWFDEAGPPGGGRSLLAQKQALLI